MPRTASTSPSTRAPRRPSPTRALSTSGTFKPANYNGGDSDTTPPAPAAGGSDLSVFNNTDPNGTWKLYVLDDTASGTGFINDWSLKIDNALHAVPAGTQADRIAHAILSDQSTFVSASWDDTKLSSTSTPDGYATPQGPDILFDNNTATLAGFPPLPSTATSGSSRRATRTSPTTRRRTRARAAASATGAHPADIPPAATRRSTSRRCGSG